MSSTDELSNVVPTSDPYEELLGPSPLRSSDPYEEVNIPGFSQRDETRDAVDAEFKSLHDHAARRELRRSRLQWKRASRTPSTTENYHAAKRHCTMAAAVEDIEYDLLRLHCDDLKEERDNAQEESAELREECKRLRQELDQHRVSLAFFTGETGRWRWGSRQRSYPT
ncbi:hypothetical protein B0H14DRAFT_3154451 [Mycena olivaceomarginata]|nr:hypothetical protein B0H14DRAFT_3154451 [Mycena olivaceomarginata]